MDARFTQHLLQVQANEMVKYIETLEKNNSIMLQFIKEHGLGDAFSQSLEPKNEIKDSLPQQTSTPRGIMEVHE